MNKHKLVLFLTTISLLFLYSCNRQIVSQRAQSNEYIEGMYYSYNNDSIRLRVDLFGDYLLGNRPLYNNTINSRQINNDNKILSRYSDNIKLYTSNFLFKASTNIPPFYHFRAYGLESFKNKLQHPLEDLNNKILVFNIDSDSPQHYLFFFEIDKKTLTQSLEGLKREASGILDGIYKGNNYKRYNDESPFSIANQSFNSDTANYLNAIKVINRRRPLYQKSGMQDMYTQAALTYNSYVGHNSDYNSFINEFYLTKKEMLPPYKENEAALYFMKEQSKDKQIVIKNEQHWQPKHRYLGNTLLEYYYSLGFRYLAVEGVDAKDEKKLNERKFPLQESGFYTREPQFSNMLRNALNIGFHVVGYDTEHVDREHMQAVNIYDKCLKRESDAKVLIWAGVSHIIEEKSVNPKMAYFLKEISGIDPLTIEQTQGDYHSIRLEKSYLGIYESSRLKDKCDIFLYNNYKEKDFQIKPGTKAKPIKIELSGNQMEKLKQHKELLLSVFYKHEFDKYLLNCVPLMNRLINDTKPFQLDLPDDEEYQFIIRTSIGTIFN